MLINLLFNVLWFVGVDDSYTFDSSTASLLFLTILLVPLFLVVTFRLTVKTYVY